MCSIIGSFDKSLLKEIVKENAYRGQFSYSMSSIDPETYEIYTLKEFGPLTNEIIDTNWKDGFYHLCHTQAPTMGLVQDYSRIHPASIGDIKLWHNGIIKQKWVDKAKIEFENDDEFDTRQFARHINKNITEGISLSKILSSVDGSFACALVKNNEYIKIFSNDSSIIHHNGINLSSHGMSEFIKVNPYKIYNLNLKDKTFEQEEDFKCINMPFFFAQ